MSISTCVVLYASVIPLGPPPRLRTLTFSQDELTEASAAPGYSCPRAVLIAFTRETGLHKHNADI